MIWIKASSLPVEPASRLRALGDRHDLGEDNGIDACEALRDEPMSDSPGITASSRTRSPSTIQRWTNMTRKR
ncbi:MAG: hypothetical protein OJF58_000217 [Enhydrobacter sp.]|jgi:hypothetical protein|nr:MAG: hypothetical protein OJF58_000217 [Enhydrobacter sp.]